MGIRVRNVEEFVVFSQFPIAASGGTPGVIPDGGTGAARVLPVPFDCLVRAKIRLIDSGATDGTATVVLEKDDGADVTFSVTHDNADPAGKEYVLDSNLVIARAGERLRWAVGAGLTGTTQAVGWIVLRRTGGRETL